MLESSYNIEEGIFYIFTDGASRTVFNEKLGRKTGRHGGKGIRFVYYDKKGRRVETDKSDYISYTNATNQDMELQPCIDALKIACDEDLGSFNKLMIVTDSMYVYSNWRYAFFGNRERKSWKTIYGDPVIHKKERKELNKYMRRMSIHIDFDRVKGHKDNEYNNRADTSAVKGAQSRTRILGNVSGARKRFFKEKTKVKGFLPVSGQEIFIHIYFYKYLRKKRFRYNYELVSGNHDLWGKTGRIYYEKSTLSAEFIYLVRIKNDGSNQIEEIISTHTKDEIREKMISEGIDKELFYGKI